jgi:hypothetical protein
VKRSKPRVGHGGQIFCGYTAAESGKRIHCEI